MTIKIEKKMRKAKVQVCIISKEDDVIFQYAKNKKQIEGLQKINSCTKSIVSALIGACLDRALLSGIDIPIRTYFEDYSRGFQCMKKDITIEHLLTMSAGYHWPEFGEWNCFAPMVYQKDMIRFILERDLINQPGECMNYNSGCSHLLGAIIQKLTNKSLEDFADEVLFRPLGINDYNWYEIQGVNLGADGLRLSPESMMKIGRLYLNNGVYNGKRLLSEQWIHESTSPRYRTYDNIGDYCYHWWRSDFDLKKGKKVPFFFALGYGGQYIIVVPSVQLVAVILSQNYEDSLEALRLFRKTILPAIHDNAFESIYY